MEFVGRFQDRLVVCEIHREGDHLGLVGRAESREPDACRGKGAEAALWVQEVTKAVYSKLVNSQLEIADVGNQQGIKFRDAQFIVAESIIEFGGPLLTEIARDSHPESPAVQGLGAEPVATDDKRAFSLQEGSASRKRNAQISLLSLGVGVEQENEQNCEDKG